MLLISAPVIRSASQNVTTVVAAFGEEIRLPCQGKDGSGHYWLKDNKTLQLGRNQRIKLKKNKYLKIKKARKQDEGIYTCVARNYCGHVLFTWNVSVAESDSDRKWIDAIDVFRLRPEIFEF